MDFQRIFVLLGLAVTAYLLVLAWNEDYGQKPVIDDAPPAVVSDLDSPGIPLDPIDGGHEIPDAREVIPGSTEKTVEPPNESVVVRSRLIEVETDVLALTIDLQGGDIERVLLPQFPERIETPDVPFPLIDPR